MHPLSLAQARHLHFPSTTLTPAHILAKMDKPDRRTPAQIAKTRMSTPPTAIPHTHARTNPHYQAISNSSSAT